ncbi:MAG: LysR family transcriptional regulator [Pseudolabrys sp.]
MIWNNRIGRRLKLQDLHIFMTVAETESMGKAAELLSISQSSVSKAIAEIEHTIGVRLLDRTPKGVAITAYGRALLRRGIGDAVDLGWKLGCGAERSGGEGFLFSYDVERRPIGTRNVRMTTQFYLEHENLETESGHRFARDAALDPRRISHREHITSGPAKGPPSISGKSQWEKPELPRHPKEPGGGARPIRRQPSSPSERSTKVRNDQLAYLSMKKRSVSSPWRAEIRVCR